MLLRGENSDDDGIPGIAAGDGQDYMAAGDHITRGDVAGDIDTIEIGSK